MSNRKCDISLVVRGSILFSIIAMLMLNIDLFHSGSLFTNSNWFAFEDRRTIDEHGTASIASSFPNTGGHDAEGADNVVVEEDDNLADTIASKPYEHKSNVVDDMPSNLLEGPRESETSSSDKPPEWVEWRKSCDSFENPPPLNTANTSEADQLPSLPNGEVQVELEDQPNKKVVVSLASTNELADTDDKESLDARDSPTNPSQYTQATEGKETSKEVVDSHAAKDDSFGPKKCEKDN